MSTPLKIDAVSICSVHINLLGFYSVRYTRINKQNLKIFQNFFEILKMKFILFFGAALVSAKEPWKWTWYNIETNTTTEYMAVLPEAAEYKNQTAAYKARH